MSNPWEMVRKAGDRSKFSHTCNLLSQYIKEKGALRDLAIDILAPRPVLHDFKGKSEAPTKIVDLIQTMGTAAEESTNKTVVLPDLNTATPNVKASQMTIFYGGKVVVFDNFPEEKAKELITMASEGISRVPMTRNCPPPRGAAPASTSGAGSPTPATASPSLPEKAQAPVSSADLPIARRVSLNRFLEKRKDRISSKAPYQVQDSPHASSSSASPQPQEMPQANQEDAKSWLGLAPSAPSSSSEHRQQ